MKTLWYVYFSAVFILSACAKESSQEILPETSVTSAIVGGTETSAKNLISKYVVFIFDEKNDSYCTGTLINRRAILTAAHCVDAPESSLTLAFGTDPLSGHYIRRKVAKVIIHPDYNSESKDARNDLALIRVLGTVPEGFFNLRLPNPTFPLEAGLSFTAVGYGRVTGVPDHNDPQNRQGSGVLRNVDLKIENFNAQQTQFTVDQRIGRGICSGDSGGPAIMRYKDMDFIVGVASAINWSTRQPPTNEDVCSQRSIYMNLKSYHSWLEQNLKNLMQ